MTTEHFSAPEGFWVRNLSEIHGHVAVPNDWFSQHEFQAEHKIHRFHITQKPLDEDGLYTIGMTITEMPAETNGGKSLVGAVLEALVDVPPLSIADSDTDIEVKSPNIVIGNCSYVMPHDATILLLRDGDIVERHLARTRFLRYVLGNGRTDRVTRIQFQSPLARWKQNQPIVDVMLGSISLAL